MFSGSYLLLLGITCAFSLSSSSSDYHISTRMVLLPLVIIVACLVLPLCGNKGNGKRIDDFFRLIAHIEELNNSSNNSNDNYKISVLEEALECLVDLGFQSEHAISQMLQDCEVATEVPKSKQRRKRFHFCSSVSIFTKEILLICSFFLLAHSWRCYLEINDEFWENGMAHTWLAVSLHFFATVFLFIDGYRITKVFSEVQQVAKELQEGIAVLRISNSSI